MADEYISKQAFNNAIRDAVRKYPNTFYNGLEVARQIAHDMDAADVAPVRHARNIYSTVPEHCEFKCSLCGAELSTVYGGRNDFGMDGGYLKYCPNCGAKMDEAKHEQGQI